MNLANLYLYFLFAVIRPSSCDLFSSSDELVKLDSIKEQFIKTIDNQIERLLSDIQNLRLLRREFQKLDYDSDAVAQINPIKAFADVRSIVRVTSEVFDTLDKLEAKLYSNEQHSGMLGDLDSLIAHLDEDQSLPSNEDLVGAGMALLRLRKFYNLTLDQMIAGDLYPNIKEPRVAHLHTDDCFELAKIAYENGDYIESVAWFARTFRMLQTERDLATHSIELLEDMINEILDYVAFAAYKIGYLNRSIALTRILLKRVPGHERAQENMPYYLEESNYTEQLSDYDECGSDDSECDMRLMGKVLGELTDKQHTLFDHELGGGRSYAMENVFSPNNYRLEDDQVVRRLCNQQKSEVIDTRPVCTRAHSFPPNQARLEFTHHVLNEDPRVVQILDFVSQSEADEIVRLARPNLARSTVHTKAGLTASNFRIAKTAWLPADSSATVTRIMSRVSEVLGVRVDDAEAMQVVNYGLGGFYGPHTDSARTSEPMHNHSLLLTNITTHKLALAHNDRLATALIYLNDVQAGGATVFPELNLTVQPIARSAVMWFNLRRDTGYTDARTLHTGCPVLYGSKWIATVWPREASNTFIVPCNK